MSFQNKFLSPHSSILGYLHDFCDGEARLTDDAVFCFLSLPWVFPFAFCHLSEGARWSWGCAVGRGPGRSEIFFQSRLLFFALESFSQVPHYQFFADSIFASLFAGISFKNSNLLHTIFFQRPCLTVVE